MFHFRLQLKINVNFAEFDTKLHTNSSIEYKQIRGDDSNIFLTRHLCIASTYYLLKSN